MSSTAFVIETATTTAGIAVADGDGYRFFASHPCYGTLEGRRFTSIAAAERAARQREAALAGNGGRRQDSRGEVFRSFGACCGMVA
ncbi:hypothetical protein [Rhodocista pekingensis]|uniref:Uncharacterized protein n=1 Tax=Rhodocista pekingensis TaxID=201185 RepID=A0ABW2KR16_9PROT